MILVTQLAGIVQSKVAFTAGADDASVAVLRIAWLIFMLPHSIVAVSIATPYFTRMSADARDGDLAAVRDRPVGVAAHHRPAGHRIRRRPGRRRTPLRRGVLERAATRSSASAACCWRT